MGLLDGKVAVITGAGSGMAKASVKVFVREGAKVVAADISGAEKDTAAEVGDGVLPVHCDVTQGSRRRGDDPGRGRGVRSRRRRAQRGRHRRRRDARRRDDGALRQADGRRPARRAPRHEARDPRDARAAATAARSSTGRRSAGSTPRRSRACTRRPRPGVISLTKAAAVEYGAQGHPRQRALPRLHPHRDHGRRPRAHARHAREGGAEPRRPAGRGRRGRGVPRVGPRLVRHRRRSSRSTAAGPPSSPELSVPDRREARPVRVPRTRRRPPTPSTSSPSSARRRRCSRAVRASSRCWRCGSRSSTTSSTSAASPSCRASSAATARCGSAPARPQAAVEAQRRGRGRGAAARAGDAVHRPLPDPQPRHARRIDRARRPGRRVPGRRAGARRDHGGRLADGSPHHRGARLLRRPLEHEHASPTSSSSACRSRSGAAACGFAVEEFARRHGDFAIAGATIGVELDDDDRIRRCAIGLIGLGSTPERADGRRGRARRAGRSPTSTPRRSVAWPMAGLASVPADLHGSAAYRTRVGAAMVARAWTAAARGGARCVRCRCG